MTCGVAPKVSHWVFEKIKWQQWSLTLQMVSGVCCSMSFVLAAMGLLVSVSNQFNLNII